MAPAILHMTDTVQYSTVQRTSVGAIARIIKKARDTPETPFEGTCKRKKMATLNEQRKKRARLGFRYTMELNFASEDSKKAFLSRVESAKPRLAPRGSPPLDSRELLSSLLDMAETTPRSSACYHVH